MENIKSIIRFILKSTTLIFIIVVLSITFLVVFLVRQCTKTETDNINIEATSNQLLSVMPQNDIYVATAVIEDFVTEQRTEYHLSLFPEHHSCIQILRQKVSYVIRLSDVEYYPTDKNTMTVRLPQLQYIASTQSSNFISDDETFWIKALPSTHALTTRVEQKIKSQFDTPEHRRQAALYAQETLTHILSQLGYETIFETTGIESESKK